MRWWLIGFVVLWSGGASGAARWPAAPCNDVREMEHRPTDIQHAPAVATARQALLLLLRDHCGVDVSSEKATIRSKKGEAATCHPLYVGRAGDDL
jgi:hypothetical protein